MLRNNSLLQRQRHRRPRIRMPRLKPRHPLLRQRRHPVAQQRPAHHPLRLKHHPRPPKSRRRCRRVRPPRRRRIKLSPLCHRVAARCSRCLDSGRQFIRVQVTQRPERLRTLCLQDLEVLRADPEPRCQCRADPERCLLTGRLEGLL